MKSEDNNCSKDANVKWKKLSSNKNGNDKGKNNNKYKNASKHYNSTLNRFKKIVNAGNNFMNKLSNNPNISQNQSIN